MAKLRIAMLAPISWRVPPHHYGAYEQVAGTLTEGLVHRGVDVTLFATGDSQTAGKLHWICPRPYSEDPKLDPKVWECLHISEVFEHAGEFDLIHNHFDFLPLTYSRLVSTPVLTTIHGFSSPQILPVYRKYNHRVYYVSISNASRHPGLNYIATAYHGISLEDFPFNEKGGDYLLFLGRIHPDKGTYEAIQVAKKAEMPLIIAGLLHDRRYFEERVKPYVDGVSVKYMGTIDKRERASLMGNAKAFLHLINFDEPFGLAVVEAMACGTPVIAIRRGAMPEVIRDGETGFLVDSLEETIESLQRIDDIDRKRCRAWVEEHFTQGRMVEEYLQVYEKILGGGREAS